MLGFVFIESVQLGCTFITHINKVIVDIVVPHVKAEQVSHNKNASDKNVHEPILTLFNISLSQDDLNQKLSPEETQIIREYIHELLKNDWSKQTS